MKLKIVLSLLLMLLFSGCGTNYFITTGGTINNITNNNNVYVDYGKIIRQKSDVTTSSNTVFSSTDMVFNVNASKIYTLKCDVLFNGAAATTGQAIRVSNTGTTSNVLIVYDTWSSATAKVGFSATSWGGTLTGTGSGATVTKPNLIIVDFTTTSAGVVSLDITSEVSASNTIFKAGSVCVLMDNTLN